MNNNSSSDFKLTQYHQRYEFMGFIVVGIIVYLIGYGRYLLGAAPSGPDAVNYFIPHWDYIQQTLRDGRWPFFNPLTFGGRPLLASIQLGVLYPPNFLMIFFPVTWGYALLIALHGAWAMVGCIMLGRKLGFPPAASLIGATTFALCPTMLFQMHTGAIVLMFAVSWWPWLCYSLIALRQNADMYRLTLASLFLLMSLLSGSPQMTYYGWLVALSVGLFYGKRIQHHTKQSARIDETTEDENASGLNSKASGVRDRFFVILAFGFALALAAPQLLPTKSMIDQQADRSGEAAWEYVTKDSVPLKKLLILAVNPHAYGPGYDENQFWGGPPHAPALPEMSFWLSWMVSLVLVPAGLVGLFFSRQLKTCLPPNAIRLGWLALAGIITTLMIISGRDSLIYQWAYKLIPGISLFRLPSRMGIIIDVGLIYIAMLGIVAIMTGRKYALTALITGVISLFLVIIFPFYTSAIDMARIQEMPMLGSIEGRAFADNVARSIRSLLGPHLIFITLGLFMPLLFFIGSTKRMKQLCILIPYVFCLLIGIDMGWMAKPYQLTTGAASYNEKHYPHTPLIESLKESRSNGRILWLDDVHAWTHDQNNPELYPNRMMMHGLPDLRGYAPVNAFWWTRWCNLLAGLAPDQPAGGMMFVPQITRPKWLTHAGVELVVTYQNLTHLKELEKINEIRMPNDILKIYRNTEYNGSVLILNNESAWMNRAQERIRRIQTKKNITPDWVESIHLHDNQPDSSTENMIVPSLDWIYPFDQQNLAEEEISPKIELISENSTGIQYRATLQKPTAVVFPVSAWPGFSLSLSDEPYPLEVIHDTFLGARLPAGDYTFKLEYRPQGWTLGWLIALIACVVLGYGSIRQWLLQKKNQAV